MEENKRSSSFERMNKRTLKKKYEPNRREQSSFSSSQPSFQRW